MSTKSPTPPPRTLTSPRSLRGSCKGAAGKRRRYAPLLIWRDGRVVYRIGLENRRGLIAFRGFESYSLRHYRLVFVVLEINETGIVIGRCSHRGITDVKEAGGRVRSQLTVGRIWAISSVEEQLLYTEKVGSSTLSSPTISVLVEIPITLDKS